MISRLNVAASALAMAFVLVGCSGGGGGSTNTPAPGPAPAPVNRAPSVNITAPLTVVDELQMISVSAAGSDADGDSLTYSWTQTGGPSLNIGTQAAAEFSVLVPDLTADETYTFEVSVSDGEDTTTSTIEIVGQNIALSPVTAQWQNTPSRISYEGDLSYIQPYTRGDSTSGSFEQIRTLILATTDVVDEQTTTSTHTYEHLNATNFDLVSTDLEIVESDDVADFNENISAVVDTRIEYEVAYDIEDTILNVRSKVTKEVIQTIELGQTVCFVASAREQEPNLLDRFYFSDVIIGFESGGLAVLEDQRNLSENLAVDATTGLYNAASMLPTFSSPVLILEDGDFCNPLGGFNTIDVIGNETLAAEDKSYAVEARFFDEAAQTIKTVQIPTARNYENASVTQTLEIGLGDGSTQFEFVTHAIKPLLDLGSGSLVVYSFSSGEYAGDHYLIAFEIDGYGGDVDDIRTFKLPNGKPSSLSLIERPNQGEREHDIVVVSKDSPFMVFIENTSGSAGVRTAFSFADPQYLEVGFGASQVSGNAFGSRFSFFTGPNIDDDLYIAFPDENEIRIYPGVLTSN